MRIHSSRWHVRLTSPRDSFLQIIPLQFRVHLFWPFTAFLAVYLVFVQTMQKDRVWERFHSRENRGILGNATKKQNGTKLVDWALLVHTLRMGGVCIRKQKLKRRRARLEAIWKVRFERMHQQRNKVNVAKGIFHTLEVLGRSVLQTKDLELFAIKDKELWHKLGEIRCSANDRILTVGCDPICTLSLHGSKTSAVVVKGEVPPIFCDETESRKHHHEHHQHHSAFARATHLEERTWFPKR